jgi:oxygen-independent coproporphyrinogen-3 oxidase
LVQGGGERFANQRGVDNYLAQWGPSSDASGAVAPWLPAATASGLSLYEQHQPDALAREAIWLGLRRLDGVSCRQFVAQYGVDPRQIFADSVAAMQKRGWLDLDGDTLRLSAAGLLFADEVGAAFL